MAKCVMRVQKKKSRLKGVIVLVGNPNVGKSTTLINLSKILLDEEDAFFYYELKKQKKSKDRRIVLRTDRWIVGIGTAGDDRDHLDENFKFFRDQRCDIGVMASRFTLENYCKTLARKCKAKFARIEKGDMKTRYAQSRDALACAEWIRDALKESRVSRVLSVANEGGVR